MNSQCLEPWHRNYPNANVLNKWHFSTKKRETSPRSQTLIIISSLQKLAIWDHHLRLVPSVWNQECERALHNPCQKKIEDRYTWSWSEKIIDWDGLDDKKNLWNKQRMKTLCIAEILFPFSKNCRLRKNISPRSKSVTYCLIYSMMMVLRWSNMVLFVTLVHGFQSLTNVTKNSTLVVGRVLDRLLKTVKLL